MEYCRDLINKVLKKKKSIMASAVILQGLEIHFYLPETHQIIHLSGSFTAEELCVEAAKKLGKCFSAIPQNKHCNGHRINNVSILQVYLHCVAVCSPFMMNLARSGIHPITCSVLMRLQD